ncbi:hypothetical protein NEMBOFW57_001059 [Staphylotrichum longicolle]|uniref:Heterokaryon incompatibility domain-containing protein n=1 Tax=Staphylotrichum longicolle TaxID=669026 RepID=A0AAD4HXK3_9PEZI|nr:hypothetical protein NEMBOFW57_001059 [Staphylotrichum longicolle]
MRLLNTTTLELKQFFSNIPPYAILSHTWGEEEVSYQEIDQPGRDRKKGFAKILGCCRQAVMDELQWAWIDTCCIDKTSSAELSEAINSMYAWYRDSHVCYVYLEDISSRGPGADGAPYTVEFYSASWDEIGTKFGLCDEIEAVTTVPRAVLLGQDNAMEQCCIAQKMSWASTRETTRVEDEAYCLLGLFGINMPMLYGEGERVFQRLQEEIIRQTEDYSFLLWTGLRPWISRNDQDTPPARFTSTKKGLDHP